MKQLVDGVKQWRGYVFIWSLTGNLCNVSPLVPADWIASAG